MQLQRQLDQFRSTQPLRRAKLPESLWEAAVELARQHGVYSVAQPLRLDYMGLKKRLGERLPATGERHPGRRSSNWDHATSGDTGGVRHRVRVLARGEDAHPVEGDRAAGLGQPCCAPGGKRKDDSDHHARRCGFWWQWSLVDFRKGIDSLAELCREKLDAWIHVSGYLFVFRSRMSNASIKGVGL